MLVVDFERFVDEEAGSCVRNHSEERGEDTVVHDARRAPTLSFHDVSEDFKQMLVPARVVRAGVLGMNA